MLFLPCCVRCASQVFALHPLYLSLDALSDCASPEVQQQIQTARQELDLPVGLPYPYASYASVRMRPEAVSYQAQNPAVADAVPTQAQLLSILEKPRRLSSCATVCLLLVASLQCCQYSAGFHGVLRELMQRVRALLCRQ